MYFLFFSFLGFWKFEHLDMSEIPDSLIYRNVDDWIFGPWTFKFLDISTSRCWCQPQNGDSTIPATWQGTEKSSSVRDVNPGTSRIVTASVNATVCTYHRWTPPFVTVKHVHQLRCQSRPSTWSVRLTIDGWIIFHWMSPLWDVVSVRMFSVSGMISWSDCCCENLSFFGNYLFVQSKNWWMMNSSFVLSFESVLMIKKLT